MTPALASKVVTLLNRYPNLITVNGEAIYGCGPTPFADAHGSYDPATLDKGG